MALKNSDKPGASATPIEGGFKAPAKPLEPAVLPEITSGIRVRQLTPFGNMHINITVDPRTEREMEVFAQLGKGGDLANSDLEAICRMVSLWLRSGGSLEHVIQQLLGIGSSLQVQTKEGKIMSLGDGLARALLKYMKAKSQAGLRALLIGETSVDHAAEVRNPANGHGNGHGRTNGNGHGLAVPAKTNGSGHTTEAATTAARSADESSVTRVTSRLDSFGLSWQHSQYKVLCPDCQSALRFGEGCMTCDSCGFSKC